MKASWSCVCLILRLTLRVCFAGAPAGCGDAVKACAATSRAERYTVCVCADATALSLEQPYIIAGTCERVARATGQPFEHAVAEGSFLRRGDVYVRSATGRSARGSTSAPAHNITS